MARATREVSRHPARPALRPGHHPVLPSLHPGHHLAPLALATTRPCGLRPHLCSAAHTRVQSAALGRLLTSWSSPTAGGNDFQPPPPVAWRSRAMKRGGSAQVHHCSAWRASPAVQLMGVYSSNAICGFSTDSSAICFTGQGIIDRRGIMVVVDPVQNASSCSSLAPRRAVERTRACSSPSPILVH